MSEEHDIGLNQHSCDVVDFNQDLLQQKAFLRSKFQRTIDAEVNDMIEWDANHELALVFEQCQILYGWAIKWAETKDGQSYVFGTKEIEELEDLKAGSPNATAQPDEAENQAATSPVEPAQPPTVDTVDPNVLAVNDNDAPGFNQAEFEKVHLPLAPVGETRFGRKDIFLTHPSSLEDRVDDSTSVDTVLRDFPNHIPSIACRIKLDRFWTTQRIAQVLFDHGHQSIFSSLPDDLHLECLANWVRRRRGCGTQKLCQANARRAANPPTMGDGNGATD